MILKFLASLVNMTISAIKQLVIESSKPDRLYKVITAYKPEGWELSRPKHLEGIELSNYLTKLLIPLF